MSACKGMNCGCTDGVSHSVECRAEYFADSRPVTACTCRGLRNLVPLLDGGGEPLRVINGVFVCPVCEKNPLGIDPYAVTVTATRTRGGSEC